ncbi:dipeptidase PepE [Glaciecola petra]|uniref:Dipeptidase PepE n=1 Tax=Glaciecola petra TaxID=3075602 RepID=A0ABU2ZT93_9ALTE|nr:dipeptidase PepE [Aestuariibacter sp. P117]MDT0594637.1 dipeptidase PepE [Aestuariibacter sp. P117]
MNILMLSSSKYADHPYLGYAQGWISDILEGQKDLLFIPHAGVTVSWDAYTEKVQQALSNTNIRGIHTEKNPNQALGRANAILIGGGNTFRLLHELYKNDLIDLIQKKIQHNTPYIGWSAGSNICGLSICTTNDMPIIEPASFDSLKLINAQLNPHYTNYTPKGHHGETRDQRIAEFCTLNPITPVLAIPEGTALRVKGNKLSMLGSKEGYVFHGDSKQAISSSDDLSEYL